MNEPPIGIGDLKSLPAAGNDPTCSATMNLVSAIMQSVVPFRLNAANTGDFPDLEALISALAISAGIIHGELQELGQVREITDDELHHLMRMNFRCGQNAGQAKVQRVHVERAAAELAASGQVPS